MRPAVAGQVCGLVLQPGRGPQPAGAPSTTSLDAFRQGSAVYDGSGSDCRGHSAHALAERHVSLGDVLGLDRRAEAARTSATSSAISLDVVSKNGAPLPNVGPKPDGLPSRPKSGICCAASGNSAFGGSTVRRSTAHLAVHDQRGGLRRSVEDTFLNDEYRVPFTAQDIRFTTSRRRPLRHATRLGW